MKQGKIVAIVFMFIMLMVTQKLIAVYPLTRTYSISPDSLHQIRWDGFDSYGNKIGSGIYIVRALDTKGNTYSARVVNVKYHGGKYEVNRNDSLVDRVERV
jgi:flagellar hook assembly protein FlgD